MPEDLGGLPLSQALPAMPVGPLVKPGEDQGNGGHSPPYDLSQKPCNSMPNKGLSVCIGIHRRFDSLGVPLRPLRLGPKDFFENFLSSCRTRGCGGWFVAFVVDMPAVYVYYIRKVARNDVWAAGV